MIKLKKGDIFCTRNPMFLGKIINFVQKIRSKDNHSKYSHSGIILNEDGTTFEALWTNKKQNLFDAYKNREVIIARNILMTPERFSKGWEGVKKHEGKWYAGHRLPLFFISSFLPKYLSLGLGVCSELTMKFLCKAGLVVYWKNWNPDDIHDMIKNWKNWKIIFEGIIDEEIDKN